MQRRTLIGPHLRLPDGVIGQRVRLLPTSKPSAEEQQGTVPVELLGAESWHENPSYQSRVCAALSWVTGDVKEGLCYWMMPD